MDGAGTATYHLYIKCPGTKQILCHVDAYKARLSCNWRRRDTMVFKNEEKIILKAIMTRLEMNDDTSAFTPVSKNDLKTDMDQWYMDNVLNDMASRGLLFVAGGLVTLSEMGVNTYSLLRWMEKNKIEE